MLNNKFNKKFSIGISLELDENFYDELFKKYNHLISEVYFSAPLGLKFQSRLKIYNYYENNGFEKLIKILNLAKKYNINLELAINSNINLKMHDVNECYLWCKDNDIKINTIVTFNHLISYTKFIFGDNIKYVCSYNQNLRKYEDLYKISELFDEVVIGNNFIRDTTAFFILKERGFKIRLLLNNGCSHNCLWCSSGNSKYCDDIFKNNLTKRTIEELIAEQSVFPNEIFEFYEKIGLIDSYKLSSRGIENDTFKRIIKVYFDNDFNYSDINDISATMLLSNISKYTYKNFNNIDLNKIINIKSNLINNEIKKIEV